MEATEQTRIERLRAWAMRNNTNHPFAGPDHVSRVVALSLEIGKSEGACLETIEAAALLHDIAVPICPANHYEVGAVLAVGVFAKMGYAPQEIEAICHAIEAHSRYGGPEPATIEAKCIYDADAIDYVGAIGLARGIGRASAKGEYTGDVARLLPIGRSLIDSVRGICYTRKGKELMESRIRNTEKALAVLESEL